MGNAAELRRILDEAKQPHGDETSLEQDICEEVTGTPCWGLQEDVQFAADSIAERTGADPEMLSAAILEAIGHDLFGEAEEGGLWIQGAVKKPGRLLRILGVAKGAWEKLKKSDKISKIKAALADLKGVGGEEAKSKRGALVLGLRFVKGIQDE